jgi:hypothetical protein
MLVTIEANTSSKLRQLAAWAKYFHYMDRTQLIDLATNPQRKVKNINVRLSSILFLRESGYATNAEVEKLFNLVKDEKDFPIWVDAKSIIVKEVTGEKDHEDLPYKQKLKRNIEENVAMLRSEAALMIAEFGQRTMAYKKIKPEFITTLKEILDRIATDPIFVDQRTHKTSSYFNGFLKALYLADRRAAVPYMTNYGINLSDLFPPYPGNAAK